MMRRALVLTNESARHPFRASLPPAVRHRDVHAGPRSMWHVTASDMRGVASTYFACLAAALVFIF